MAESEKKRSILDYEEGLKRFSGVETLYHKYLLKFLEEPSFRQFCSAMDSGEYEEAFRGAHTLKGLAGNLSLNELFDRISPLVDALREGADIPAALGMRSGVEESYAAAVEKVKTCVVSRE